MNQGAGQPAPTEGIEMEAKLKRLLNAKSSEGIYKIGNAAFQEVNRRQDHPVRLLIELCYKRIDAEEHGEAKVAIHYHQAAKALYEAIVEISKL